MQFSSIKFIIEIFSKTNILITILFVFLFVDWENEDVISVNYNKIIQEITKYFTHQDLKYSKYQSIRICLLICKRLLTNLDMKQEFESSYWFQEILLKFFHK